MLIISEVIHRAEKMNSPFGSRDFFLEESLVFKQRKPLSLCVIGFIFHDTVSQANLHTIKILTYDTVSRQIFVEWIANDNHLCYT